MKKKLLFILAVTSTCFSETLSSPDLMSSCREPSSAQGVCLLSENTDTMQDISVLGKLMSIVNPNQNYAQPTLRSIEEIKEMLQKESRTLNRAVIEKVVSTLKCATENKVDYNPILTIIDYSLPSSQKRLWVFDLNEKKLLFYTYVSHGIKSGLLLTNHFSNINNSKASSIGVYKTEKAYYGRDGLSLRLDGLDRGFNDNASNRSVVMHGGWYVEEAFIKKYGRAGRSWGCPAVPLLLSNMIINTIKGHSLFVAYYPSDNWFLKSRFLKCDPVALTQQTDSQLLPVQSLTSESERRDDVLFTDSNKKTKRMDENAIVAITAENYAQIFHTKAPLTRMLRRQIDHIEYIALSNTEFKNMVINHNKLQGNETQDDLSTITIITPVVKMTRGYYATEMKIVNLGKIKDVLLNMSPSQTMEQLNSYTIHFEKNSVINLKSTDQFIRWIGL